MTRYFFDDCNIKWQNLEGFENLAYSILNIDEYNKIIDVIFKFAANKQIVLHRHLALNNTFVIRGESLFLRKLLWASLPNKRQKLRDR